MAMDRETATSILNEAKEAEYEDRPIPEGEAELISRAEYFWREAKKSFSKGMRDNCIQKIIWLGDSVMSAEDIAAIDAETGIGATYPRRSSGGLSESDERETAAQPVESKPAEPSLAEKENLPIPPHIEGDPDPLPRNFIELSDKEVRRLSSEYNAYLSRVIYLLGVESSDLANAEHLLDSEKARAVRELDIADPRDPKKSKLAKVIEAEILEDTKVAEFARAVSVHQQSVIILKSLKEIYSGNVERLSREWTMRQNEWEKSK